MKELMERSNEQTMSSREIAELSSKRHDHVLRDIENVLKQANIDLPKFGGIYLDANNREQKCYNLPRIECDLVISGYSVPYRLAIIKRWHELEAQQQPKTNAEQMLVWAQQMVDQERAQVALEKKVNLLELKTDTEEKFFSITAHAKNIGIAVDHRLAQRLGIRSSKLSRSKGYPTGEVRHGLWGTVKTYHEDILDEVFGEEGL